MKIKSQDRSVMKLLLSGMAAFLGATTPLTAAAQTPVTFADVYANPDDQALNLAYARQQADAGELLGAAAALERMLFSNANWDSARLFYAGLLVRLDDPQGARRELALLKPRPLSPAQRQQVARIEALLDDTETGLSAVEVGGFSGQVSLAARYDDNAGNVFGDVLFGGGDQADESLLFQTRLEYAAPLEGSSTTAYVTGDMTLRRHEDFSEADYDVYGIAAGLRGDAGALEWTVEADANFINIATEDYLDQFGINARFGTSVSDTATLSAVLRWHDQSFKDLPSNPAASLRSGELWEVGPEFSWQVTPDLRLRAMALYQDKSAKTASLEYDGYRLSVEARWRLSDDIYASGSGVYRQLDYKADNPFVFPPGSRQDEILRLRGGIGVAASALLPGVSALEGVSVELAANHLERDTNVPGGGFESTGGELRLTYEF